MFFTSFGHLDEALKKLQYLIFQVLFSLSMHNIEPGDLNSPALLGLQLVYVNFIYN